MESMIQKDEYMNVEDKREALFKLREKKMALLQSMSDYCLGKIAEFNPISSFSTDGFHPLKRPRTDILTPEGK